MAFWNEPSAPAWYGQQFQLHAPSLSAGLYKPRKTTTELLIEAASKLAPTLAGQMQKRKQDAIAQSLLEQEASPEDLARYSKAGLTGTAAYQQWNDDKQGEEQDVDKWYKRALENQKLESGYDSGEPSEDIVDTPWGKMPASKYAEALRRRNTPTGAQDWSKAIVLKRGKLDESGQFTNQYSGAESGPYAVLQFPKTVAGGAPMTMVVPYSSYQEKIKTAAPSNGFSDAGAVEPAELPGANAGTDLKARAQAALTDPEATAQEKAAAKRILGL